jgi:hypothetical protein
MVTGELTVMVEDVGVNVTGHDPEERVQVAEGKNETPEPPHAPPTHPPHPATPEQSPLLAHETSPVGELPVTVAVQVVDWAFITMDEGEQMTDTGLVEDELVDEELVNSRTLLPESASHRLPLESKATPMGDHSAAEVVALVLDVKLDGPITRLAAWSLENVKAWGTKPSKKTSSRTRSPVLADLRCSAFTAPLSWVSLRGIIMRLVNLKPQSYLRIHPKYHVQTF